MKRTSIIQLVCSVLLLCFGIYLNVYNQDAAFKAFVIPEPLQSILFIALLIFVGVSIFTHKKGIRYAAVTTIVAIVWYYLGLKVPYAGINSILNNANPVFMKVLSIAIIIIAMIWIMCVILKRTDEPTERH